MSQQRAIRQALVAAITAALPGVPVLVSPRRELAPEELPAVCVYSHGDRPESEDDDHANKHLRVYTLRVELRMRGLGEEETTEAYSQAILRAVLSDDTMAGTATRTTWSQQVWDGEEGDPCLVAAGFDFNCHYLWSLV